MDTENLTAKVVEKVELAAEVGTKVANIVGNAFESTVADAEQAHDTEPEAWISYIASFGIHVAMVIIVILLKWQYGRLGRGTMVRGIALLFRSQSISLPKRTA